jgi:hypothetical protein
MKHFSPFHLLLQRVPAASAVMRAQAILGLLSFTPYVQEYLAVAHNILNHLGSISPYHRAHHASEINYELPSDCTVDQVMLVSRGGSILSEMTWLITSH